MSFLFRKDREALEKQKGDLHHPLQHLNSTWMHRPFEIRLVLLCQSSSTAGFPRTEHVLRCQVWEVAPSPQWLACDLSSMSDLCRVCQPRKVARTFSHILLPGIVSSGKFHPSSTDESAGVYKLWYPRLGKVLPPLLWLVSPEQDRRWCTWPEKLLLPCSMAGHALGIQAPEAAILAFMAG